MKTLVKQLKVKIKSLAEEARIIRKEEGRAKGRRVKPGEFLGRDDELRLSLRYHRIVDVRIEQRASLIAYAFLRGVPFAVVERTPKSQPNWDRVTKMVDKFGVVGGRAEREKQRDRYTKWIVGERATA